MKSRIMFCLKMFGLLAGFAIAGTFLLGLVYLLPTKNVAENNMVMSAETFSAEGAYPSITNIASSRLDNYTDSLMLLKATYSGEGAPFAEAMMNRSEGIKELDPQDSLVQHYKDGEAFNTVENYSRYWHGYLIFLRPLIMMFSYKKIRIANLVLQCVLVLAFVVVLAKKKKKSLIIPFLILYGFLMPLALAKSMQFSSCFYVMMVGLFWLVLRKKNDMKNSIVIFMTLGTLVSFFDLLTYPLITFGVPLISFYLLTENGRLKNIAWSFVKLGMAWIVGYAGMWVAKWTVGSIITGQNLFSDGISQLMFRTAITGEEFSRLDVIKNNYGYFLSTPMVVLLALFIVIMLTIIVMHWRNQKKRLDVKELLISLSPYFVAMFLPVVWFLVASNHSYHHFWFTNKICTITIFALMCGLAKLCLILKKNSRIR